jgi:UDP-glucose:(heptosyl)LPS alpha-1,3-glucosyltransferase
VVKIAFAIEHYSPLHGGAERYAWRLSEWLVRQGHSVDVYTLETPDAGAAPGRVHLLPVPARPRNTKLRRFSTALTNALANQPYDIVHGFNHAQPCNVLRLGGGVHLAFERFSVMSSSNRFEAWFRRLSYRTLPHYRAIRDNERAQFSDPHRRFMAVSARVASDMAKFYPACVGRIHVIRNGLDLDTHNPSRCAELREAARARLGLEPRMMAFLFASNNFRLKGLSDLIRVLPDVRRKLAQPIQLIVVGRGNTHPFERQAGRLGVRDLVHFDGSASNLLEYYAAADALLHPTYYDACSNVCLEAMACGLPVLTTRSDGASEVMEDGKGAVILDMPAPPGALVEGILRVSDPAFRSAARDQQWARARKLPMEDNFKTVSTLYQQALKR